LHDDKAKLTQFMDATVFPSMRGTPNFVDLWLTMKKTFASLFALLALSWPLTLLPAALAQKKINGSEPYQKAFELIAQRQFELARQHFTKFDGAPASKAERLALEAWLDITLCRFTSAVRKSSDALALNESQPLALVVKARLLASEGKLDEAVPAAKAAVKEDGNNPVILWWAADVMFQQKSEWQTAMQFFERVVQLGGSPEIKRPSVEWARELIEIMRQLKDRTDQKLAQGSPSRAELPLVWDGNARLFNANITAPNGNIVTFRLDTGMNTVSLHTSAAPNFPLEPFAKGTYQSLGGRMTMDRVLIKKFQLGAMQFESVQALTATHVNNNILGYNLFRDGVLALDFRRQRLQFFMDREAFEKEWTPQLQRANAAPIRLFRNQIYLPVTFTSSGGATLEGALFVDSAAASSRLSSIFLSTWNRECGVPTQAGRTINIRGASGATQQVMLRTVSNVEMRAGNTVFRDAQMEAMDYGIMHDSTMPLFSGLLGLSHLRRHQFVIIDGPRRQIYFGPPAGN
jgi:tetratricopeptide (TPR) repeat protein